MKHFSRLLTACLVLGVAGVAAAAEGEGFMARNATALEVGAGLINFLVFVWILVKFAGPKVKAMFANNAEEYHEKVDEAARALEAAQQAHDDWTKRYDALQTEIEDIKETARNMAKSQAKQIVAEAKVAAERIIEDARRSAEAEIIQATDRLRAELVDHVMDGAEKQLRERLSPSHQKMLVEEAIKKLEATQ
jgi:F-type H+-transporting ATPase subunit b